jgi:hypothetical protein
MLTPGLFGSHLRYSSIRKPNAPGHCGRALARHKAVTRLRSQRWAGSASMRGCHIAGITISGVRTGSSKVARPSICVSGLPREERGTSAIKSERRGMRIVSGKPGTTATTSRLSPNSARASSTGPVNAPLRDATTCRQAAYRSAETGPVSKGCPARARARRARATDRPWRRGAA